MLPLCTIPGLFIIKEGACSFLFGEFSKRHLIGIEAILKQIRHISIHDPLSFLYRTEQNNAFPLFERIAAFIQIRSF